MIKQNFRCTIQSGGRKLFVASHVRVHTRYKIQIAAHNIFCFMWLTIKTIENMQVTGNPSVIKKINSVTSALFDLFPVTQLQFQVKTKIDWVDSRLFSCSASRDIF